jgi:hypothetical protein
MTIHALTCKGCGVNFQHPSPARQFCTRACADSHTNYHQAANYIYTCKECGKEYKAKHYDRNKYCSRDCYFQACKEGKVVNVLRERLRIDAKVREAREREAKQSALQKVCVICGKQFIGKATTSRICSRECELEDKRRYARDATRSLMDKERRRDNYVPKVRACKICGIQFKTSFKKDRNLCCSLKCSDINRALGHSMRNHTRRVRVLGKYHEPISFMAVFNRDKGKCKVCKVKLTMSNRGDICDVAPELDHIIPIAHGGTHTLNNVQLLCRKCNGIKADTVKGQLVLC